MTLKDKFQTIARSAMQHPRQLAAAGIMLVAPGAALWGSQSASATQGTGYEPTSSSIPEDCTHDDAQWGEMDPCPTTSTTEAPTTTTSTSAPTTAAPTTAAPTTAAPTTAVPTTAAPTTAAPTTAAPTTVPEDRCIVDGVDVREYYNDIFETDPENAFWKTRYWLVTEQGYSEDDAHLLLLCCDLEPPVVTTTTEPTTTTTEPTTTTTEPTTTTTESTTTIVTSTPPDLPPMVVHAPPAAPAPKGPLAYTGGEVGILTLAGGGSLAAGATALSVVARSKARNATDKLRGGNVAAGGPDPDDLGFDPTPLTGDAIDATDFDTLADDLLVGPNQLYVEGENRISGMVGYKSGGKNVPDALLPASLRLNPEQTSPLVPIVPEIAPTSASIVPESVAASNPFGDRRFQPKRYFERSL